MQNKVKVVANKGLNVAATYKYIVLSCLGMRFKVEGPSNNESNPFKEFLFLSMTTVNRIECHRSDTLKAALEQCLI